jgi:type I restriction enzyme S subunit
MTELPPGWVIRRVHEVFQSFGGGTPNKATQNYWGGNIPWLSSGDIKTDRIQASTETITKAGLANSSANLCRPGSVLVVVRSGILKHTLPIAVVDREAAINQDIKCFDSGNDELNCWLALGLRTSAKDILALNREGTTVQSVKYETLKEFALPVPPPGEQRRIVAQLEKVLDKLDGCHQRLARIPVLFKRFRQSVLAAACSGRLTADWRMQNPTAEQIDATVEGIRRRRGAEANTVAQKEKLRQIFSVSERNDSIELPANWRFVFLSKLCSSFDYGTSAKSQPSGKIPVLRMGNIQAGKIDWTDLVYTSDEDEIDGYWLQPNTVLFNRTNSPELVGKSAIYRGEQPAIFAGYLIRINQFPELDPEYLHLCLNTNYAREFCARVKTDGVSQSNINAQKLGSFELPLCPLAEQQEIVRRVETLFALADQLEERFAKARAQVDKLTPSLLARAFRGDLVPTEAELANQEGRDYESASAFLERIRHDRAVEAAERPGSRG